MKTLEFKLDLNKTQKQKIDQVLQDLTQIYNVALLLFREDYQRYLLRLIPEDLPHQPNCILVSRKLSPKESALSCWVNYFPDTNRPNIPIRSLWNINLEVTIGNCKVNWTSNLEPTKGLTSEQSITDCPFYSPELKERLLGINSAIRSNALLQALRAQQRFKKGLAKAPRLKENPCDYFRSWAVEGGAVSKPIPKDVPLSSLCADDFNQWFIKNRNKDEVNFHTLGHLKVMKLCKRWQPHWILRSYRILKRASGYFVQFVVAETAPKPLPKPSKPVIGISLDTNSSQFLVDSLDRSYSIRENAKVQKRLARQLRKLDRQIKAAKKVSSFLPSNRLLKTRETISRLHESIAARRKGYHHLRSTRLVREFGALAIARPTKQEVAKSVNNLNRSLTQSGPGAFSSLIEQKGTCREILVETQSDYLERPRWSCPSCTDGVLTRSSEVLSCNKCSHQELWRNFEAKYVASKIRAAQE